jgi:hypothetical protein
MSPINYETYMLFSVGGRGKNDGGDDREVGFGEGIRANRWWRLWEHAVVNCGLNNQPKNVDALTIKD